MVTLTNNNDDSEALNLQDVHHKVEVCDGPLVQPGKDFVLQNKFVFNWAIQLVLPEEGAVKQPLDLILVLRNDLLLLEPGREEGLPVEARGGHVDHPTPRNRCRRGIVHVLWLEDQFHLNE